MGKIKTCISKNGVRSRVLNEELDYYLDNGWVIGWDEDFKKAISNGLRVLYDKMKAEGTWEDYKASIYTDERAKKLSDSGKVFWKEKATEEYILSREEKKKATRDNWTDEEKLLYHNKMSKSAKLERANKSKEDWDKINKKIFESKRKNGTFNTSKPEEYSYNLLVDLFGESDIIREYNESRYPFNCDFYIKSKDLFIECNYHYTHGGHRFNPNNNDDIKLLEDIRSKQCYLKNGNKNSYFVYEEVWTNRDLKKFEYAENNNLNYIAAYSIDELKKLLGDYI